MTITVDHQQYHRICPECMVEQGLDVMPEPPSITDANGQLDSQRCCFCGNYTPFDLMVAADPDTVPHNRRDDAWMIRTGLMKDPRIVTDQ